MVRMPISEDLFSEIFVVRDQNPIFNMGFVQDLIVGQPPCRVVDREDLVRSFPKPAGHGRPGALIDEKPQSCRLRGQRHEG